MMPNVNKFLSPRSLGKPFSTQAEYVFDSFVRGDSKAQISPLLNHRGTELYQWNIPPHATSIRTGNVGKEGAKQVHLLDCIAVRLSDLIIIYPPLVDSYPRRFLRKHGATEMFDDDFDALRGLFMQDRLVSQMRFHTHPPHNSVETTYRNDKGEAISAKTAMRLHNQRKPIQKASGFRRELGMLEEVKYILGKYHIDSPLGDNEYDCMRYYNRTFLESRYQIALLDLVIPDNIDLITAPLVVNRWTLIEDKDDAMLLMVASPCSEKIILGTDWG